MTQLPEKKVSDGAALAPAVTQRDGISILDIDRYAPFLLNAVSSAWQRQTSAIYRREFDLGTVDWRVMAMLNIETRITANRICEVVRLDKAAVSRSLKLLHERSLADFVASSTDQRRRRWWLTDAGQDVHARIMSIALTCEAGMFKDISPARHAVFLSVMHDMLRNLEG